MNVKVLKISIIFVILFVLVFVGILSNIYQRIAKRKNACLDKEVRQTYYSIIKEDVVILLQNANVDQN